MKVPSFLSLLAASSWVAGAAAAVLPRSELYASMNDADPKVGSSLDTIYTDALDTCISISAFGKTSFFANKKIMVHIPATKQADKTNKFISAVSSAGYEQGSIRIAVVLPSEDYIEKKVAMDDEFKQQVEEAGGVALMQNILNSLGADAQAKAIEAVKNTGGEDDDVVVVRRKSPDDDDVDENDRGRVEISLTGDVKVEGEELDD